MAPDDSEPHDVPPMARFMGAAFGLIFLGIGLTVIGFLWGTPFGEIHSPPLVFRIFGSFIALAFVVMGGGTAFAAITGMPVKGEMRQYRGRRRRDLPQEDAPLEPPRQGGYSCDKCGASLDSSADVSPHGDVKCEHCGVWFNIHSR